MRILGKKKLNLEELTKWFSFRLVSIVAIITTSSFKNGQKWVKNNKSSHFVSLNPWHMYSIWFLGQRVLPILARRSVLQVDPIFRWRKISDGHNIRGAFSGSQRVEQSIQVCQCRNFQKFLRKILRFLLLLKAFLMPSTHRKSVIYAFCNNWHQQFNTLQELCLD